MQLAPVQPSHQPIETIAAVVQSTIRSSSPFAESPQGDIFLVPPPIQYDPSEIHRALMTMVRQGVLSGYRYIDSGPAPAVLAVTAAV
jgi:hypothetical protein